MLFSASHAMPPVSAPSPTTTTTERSVTPCSENAREMPSPHESAVEAWEFSMTS